MPALIVAGVIYLSSHIPQHVPLGPWPLVILTISLVVYALQVPTLIGFTAARYEAT